MSGVAALLPFTGRLSRSGVGRSRSYTRRLYKTSLKGGSRPIPAVQPDGLYVSNVLKVAVPGLDSGRGFSTLLRPLQFHN